MGKSTEVGALKAIDDVLSGLDDPDARNRVLAWAWEKYSSKPRPISTDAPGSPKQLTPKDQRLKKTLGAKKKGKGKTKQSLSMVKDLNLRRKGKKSFDDFVGIKRPDSYYEKCTVSVYYLKQELGISTVTANHVYTCFKHMKWRIPADLFNTLAYTASHYGWLDTSNFQAIKVTTKGENLLDHDLPKKKGSKK